MVNESNGQRAQGQVQGCALRLMVNESNGQWTQGQAQGLMVDGTMDDGMMIHGQWEQGGVQWLDCSIGYSIELCKFID